MRDIRNDFPNKRLVMDGALGTLLEKEVDEKETYHPKNLKLWSGSVLVNRPQLVKDVHLRYISAGANIITTSTYQLSYPSLIREGFSNAEISSIWKESVQIARSAINDSINNTDLYLVASIGPYATFLADGSEYSGIYQILILLHIINQL